MKFLLALLSTLALVGSGAPGATADDSVSGTVQSVEGSTLLLRADDGRTITVDLANVDARVRETLKVGQPITVVGTLGVQDNRLTAHVIQTGPASAAGHSAVVLGQGDQANETQVARQGDRKQEGPLAALPGEVTAQPAHPVRKADCKKDGWRGFSEPGFKSQRDCVTWVKKQARPSQPAAK